MGKRVARLSRPARLKAGHDLGAFDCGRAEITDWLQRRALRAGEGDTATTYVVCRGRRVVAYCALAAGAVARAEAPNALARNSPDPIPVIVLARLGVTTAEQRSGLGRALIAEAMRRAAQASKIIGARALLVHALDESLAVYYESLGFRRLAEGAQTLYLPMAIVRAGL
jgi:predicted N-acetyltransferase YhbS